MWLYIGATLAMFVETLLRGFQNKNVQQDFIKAAGICGFLMALMDALVVGFIVKAGIEIALFAAIGSGLGWVTSMHLHKVITKKHREQLKVEKKQKRERRIRRIVLDCIRKESTPA